MVHANTNSFVRTAGKSSAYTSLVIGTPNLAAILVAFVHTWLVSKEYNAHRFPSNSVGLLRTLFAISCFFGILGNVIHGMALDIGSVSLAMLGRFFFGLSSAEILSRQLVGACVPSHVVAQSARLVSSRTSGLLTGILLGVFIEMIPFTVRSLGIRWLQTSSWLMVSLWFVHFVRVLVYFRATDLPSDNEIIRGSIDTDVPRGDGNGPHYDSDSSDSHRMGSPSFLYSSSGTPLNSQDPFRDAGFAATDESGRPIVDETSIAETPKVYVEVRKREFFREMRTFFVRARKLFRYNVGIPITLFIVLYTNYAIELYLSGTSVITCRYFGWSGMKAGLFLAGLGATIIPLHLVCEFIARRYEDRTVLKVGRTMVLRRASYITAHH